MCVMRRIVVDFETGRGHEAGRHLPSGTGEAETLRATDECVEVEPLLVVSGNLVTGRATKYYTGRVGGIRPVRQECCDCDCECECNCLLLSCPSR